MNDRKVILAPLIVMAAMLVWRTTYESQCVSLAIPLLVIAIIGYQTAQLALYRRRCFADCVFNVGSPLHRLYYRAALSVLLAVLLSVVAGLSLMLNVLSWSAPVLLLLAFDGFLLAAATPGGVRMLTNHFRPAIAGTASRSLLASVNALLLLPPLLALQYFSPFPPFLDQASLPNTIVQAYEALGSQCMATNLVVKFHAAKEGLAWWLTLRASMELSDPTYRWAAWTLFLLSGSLSVWAYSKLVVQVADFAVQGDRHNGVSRADNESTS